MKTDRVVALSNLDYLVDQVWSALGRGQDWYLLMQYNPGRYRDGDYRLCQAGWDASRGASPVMSGERYELVKVYRVGEFQGSWSELRLDMVRAVEASGYRVSAV